MSTTGTTTNPNSTIKMPLVLKRAGVFWTAFGVVLIFNLLLILTVYTLGVSTGFEGVTSFSWDQFVTSTSFLFGGLGSLLALVGAVALVGVALWFVHWLTKNDHHKLVVASFVISAILGWLLLDRVNWSSFGFGFIPFLGLILVVALEASAILVSLSILSRKRDTH